MRTLYTWVGIAAVVLFSSAGDVLLSRAMKKIGDVGQLRRQIGIFGVVGRILTSPVFFSGLACMALAFFSLLLALSWADVSLVAPASASLTFVTSAIAAKFLLHENVDRRRWLAALLACAGVALLAR
ncbi:MAG TPA: EamA family transporter [Terriglobales bacterium]|nr:EamA family transporter [Terriglobales bacterium]